MVEYVKLIPTKLHPSIYLIQDICYISQGRIFFTVLQDEITAAAFFDIFVIYTMNILHNIFLQTPS